MPWRIATGLSLIIWVLAIFLIGDRLNYLKPYAEVLVYEYTLVLSLNLATAMLTLFAFIYCLPAERASAISAASSN